MHSQSGTAPLNLSQAAQVLYVAIELSKSAWVVAVQDRGKNRPSLHKLAAGDVDDLLAVAARAQAQHGTTSITCCYEIGYDGFLARSPTHGARLGGPHSGTSQSGRSTSAPRKKTDRIDVLALMRGLIAYEGGDARVWCTVTLPTAEEEDRKRQHRKRRVLIEEKGRHVNRIKGMLAQQGIYDFEPALANRWKIREQLRTGDHRTLPACLRRAIERELHRLEFVLSQIKEIESEQRQWIEREPDRQAQTVAHLTELRGIGWRSAAVVVNEALYRGFHNQRQLAAFAGLAPSPFMSGGMRPSKGSTRPATRPCGQRWSSCLGYGCVISLKAHSRAGSKSAVKAAALG